MKKPNLLDGILAAILITVCTGSISLILSSFITDNTLFKILLSFSTLSYLIYLLKRSQTQIGWFVVIMTWGFINFGSWLMGLSLIEQVILQIGLIWLVRSLYFHSSILTGFLDLGLILTGLAGSIWAILNTNNEIIALWTFLLLQSLFTLIPNLRLSPANNKIDNTSTFQSSHRVALEAVRKLSTKHTRR